MMNKINGFIDRDAHKLVEKWLKQGYIVAILGARQTGKTTLIKKLQEESGGKSYYYLLDSALTSTKIEKDPEFLRNDLEARLGNSIEKFEGEINLFLDEVQKVPQVLEQVKFWHDELKHKFHIVLSGSASLEIQQKCSESLAGRVQYVYLFPLTIAEITSYMLKEKIPSFLADLHRFSFDRAREIYSHFYPQKQDLDLLYKDLMVFGALPGVWVREEKNRFDYLRSIIELYLDKDIRSAGLVRELSDFNKLLEIASFEVGGLINVQDLSRSISTTAITLRHHLSILENTFALHFLKPYTHMRDRAVKSKKWYFFDVGVPNYLSRRLNYENVFGAKAFGGIFENVILTSALSVFKNISASWQAYFWRNYTGREIDLILACGEEIIPIEITASSFVAKRKIDNIEFFLENKKNVKKAFILYGGDLKKTEIRGVPVYFLPWVLWR